MTKDARAEAYDLVAKAMCQVEHADAVDVLCSVLVSVLAMCRPDDTLADVTKVVDSLANKMKRKIRANWASRNEFIEARMRARAH